MTTNNLPNPTPDDLESPEFEAIWQVIKNWDLSRDNGHGGYAGGSGTDVMLVLAPVRQAFVAWAVEQWQAQVAGRPIHNKHRRTLDDVWRQVIRRFGGDDRLLIGMPHDEMPQRAPSQPAMPADAEFQITQDGFIVAGAEGPRDQAWAEIQRYAAQYAEDGPIEIWEIARRRIEDTDHA